MKAAAERISYYTKKVADYGAIHHSKPRNKYRYKRLMAYKRLMHQQIEKEGWI